MGTEKHYYSSLSLQTFFYSQVKLNNPLMGTEKPLYQFNNITNIKICVKLNNPLMGTENLSSQSVFINAIFSIELN